MKQTTKPVKPIQAPSARDRAHDKQRFEQYADERLSKNAGYGRGNSTPASKK